MTVNEFLGRVTSYEIAEWIEEDKLRADERERARRAAEAHSGARRSHSM